MINGHSAQCVQAHQGCIRVSFDPSQQFVSAMIA